MGFFSSKKEAKQPEWYAQVQENQQRFFVFLEKLEAKMQELCEAAIPELTELYKTDPDVFHREYGRMKAAVLGQLENIYQKAEEVRADKIEDLYQDLKLYVSVRDDSHHLLTDFRSECGHRFEKFNERNNNWSDKVNETAYEDLEIKYQNILQEYESIKDKFKCKQCGSPITIGKIFFIDTFVACSSCQTQNTFSPSTQAQMLQHFAQDLARQRTQHLYQQYEDLNKRERELYHQRHTIKLKTFSEKDKKRLAEMQAQMDELDRQRLQAIDDAPKVHERYIRAKYAEWIKITPDQEQHLLTRMENDLNNQLRMR